MLYPRESSTKKSLTYACKLCPHTSPATTNLIYRNTLKQKASDVLSNVNPNMVDDPSMTRTTLRCRECGERDAVAFQSVQSGHDSLPLIVICAGCGHKWVKGSDGE